MRSYIRLTMGPYSKELGSFLMTQIYYRNIFYTNLCHLFFAEAQGFEPRDLLQSTVFKTAAFDRSAKPPLLIQTYYFYNELSTVHHNFLCQMITEIIPTSVGSNVVDTTSTDCTVIVNTRKSFLFLINSKTRKVPWILE